MFSRSGQQDDAFAALRTLRSTSQRPSRPHCGFRTIVEVLLAEEIQAITAETAEGGPNGVRKVSRNVTVAR